MPPISTFTALVAATSLLVDVAVLFIFRDVWTSVELQLQVWIKKENHHEKAIEKLPDGRDDG